MNQSILKTFLKDIDFAGILDGASKTLNVINQAIPVYYQVKPMFSNLKVLKNIQTIMNEDDAVDHKTSPIFYI